MPHDKIKDAARKRMAETGEPYTLARRMVIEEHKRLQAITVTVDGTPVQGEVCELPDGFGSLLGAMLGADPSPSSGSPYTHVLRLPETEEEMAAAPVLPRFTVSREGE